MAPAGTRRSTDGLKRFCGLRASCICRSSSPMRRPLPAVLERLEIEVWGLPYALAPFKYQVKCLHQLRDKFCRAGEPGDQRRAATDPRRVPDAGTPLPGEEIAVAVARPSLSFRLPVAAAERGRNSFRIPDALDQHVDAIASQNNSPLKTMVGTPNTPSASASSIMRSCWARAGPST